MSTETPVRPMKTRGQRFKELHGISYTMHRNMRKQGLDSNKPGDVETYRKGRNKWKNEIRKAKKAKADKAKAGKRNKSLLKLKNK